MPDGSMMKPEPSEFCRRGVFWGFSFCPPRRLKKSRNSSSVCGSLGCCGGVWALLRATFCDVAMLTTASITCSATSAMLSGPAASEATVSAGRTSAEKTPAANAGRRICRVIRVSVSSMGILLEMYSSKDRRREHAPLRRGSERGLDVRTYAPGQHHAGNLLSHQRQPLVTLSIELMTRI